MLLGYYSYLPKFIYLFIIHRSLLRSALEVQFSSSVFSSLHPFIPMRIFILYNRLPRRFLSVCMYVCTVNFLSLIAVVVCRTVWTEFIYLVFEFQIFSKLIFFWEQNQLNTFVPRLNRTKAKAGSSSTYYLIISYIFFPNSTEPYPKPYRTLFYFTLQWSDGRDTELNLYIFTAGSVKIKSLVLVSLSVYLDFLWYLITLQLFYCTLWLRCNTVALWKWKEF